jgi:hypothetical protein
MPSAKPNHTKEHERCDGQGCFSAIGLGLGLRLGLGLGLGFVGLWIGLVALWIGLGLGFGLG